MRRFILVLLLAIVAFLGYAASRPDTFHVERTVSIAAPADSVFPHLVSFRAWDAWSPWAKLDPTMKQEFEGTEGALASGYTWSGNDKVGAGRMTLTEATPASKVGIKLEFLKPFASTNAATFTLSPETNGTQVTWAMDGPMNLISKVMCVFTPMDKMIGPDFEKGLASLKQVSEVASATP